MSENTFDRNTEFVRSLTDDKCDSVLGHRVKAHLQELGLEPNIPETGASPVYSPIMAVEALKQGIQNAFINLGLDVMNDPSIQDTPNRYAKMFVGELTKGLNYSFFPKCTATPNGITTVDEAAYNDYIQERIHAWEGGKTREEIESFEGTQILRQQLTSTMGKYDQMVLVAGIQTMSLCEHHLQTIDGVTHIAYIPGRKVLGLSKFARVTDFFARRPQIQERMTEQIFAALCLILETEDVAVVQKATHYCMRARGAMQSSSITTTDRMGGRFMTNGALRKEFFDACS
jgi:GTP cyclohydrolase I